MSKILLAGNDQRLLKTRAAVLARTQASVIYCNPAEAMKQLEGESIDLIVLCHSLTEKQISDLTELTHQKLPSARILRVVSDLREERPANGNDFYATSSYDPAGLIRRTSELLQH